LLVTDLERGGTPLRLARLARGLREFGIEVSVGCLAPPGPVSDDLEAAGIPTFACGARSARDVFVLRRLAGHLRRIQPQLVHATLTHANVAARLVGDWLRIPVVTSTATIEVERRWHRTIERCTAHLDRGHLVNSQTLANHVAQAFRISRERICVVPPLLADPPARIDRGDARRRFDLDDGDFVIAWAGRFDPVKRLELAIRCTELLSDVNCHLLLAGDGPARAQVEALARSSSARDRIHLLGWQSDLGPAFSAADVFLFPSLTEGMPNAVLEAMAFGLPIIGSNIPALRELAGEEQRVLLIDGEGAKPFARALRSLRDSPGPRRAMADRAANWTRAHLDRDAALRALIDVYRQILTHSA
jgi:glycosyltransferase involved in cell wall biosynthesis